MNFGHVIFIIKETIWWAVLVGSCGIRQQVRTIVTPHPLPLKTADSAVAALGERQKALPAKAERTAFKSRLLVNYQYSPERELFAMPRPKTSVPQKRAHISGQHRV